MPMPTSTSRLSTCSFIHAPQLRLAPAHIFFLVLAFLLILVQDAFFSRDICMWPHPLPVSAKLSSPPSHTINMAHMQFVDARGASVNYTGYVKEAMMAYAATRLGVEDVNKGAWADLGFNPLSNYTIELDLYNTQMDRTMASAIAHRVLDSMYNQAPPPIATGFVNFDEAMSAAIASQPYQTPFLTSLVTTPSLTTEFPNMNRLGSSDQFEGMALMAVLNVFGWNEIVSFYNAADGSSTQLHQTLLAFQPTMSPKLTIQAESYSYSLTGSDAFPNIADQLAAIKKTGRRIILLSGFASDIPYLLKAMKEADMIGAPYQIIGTNAWCFDTELYENEEYGHLLKGALCTQIYVDESTQSFTRFAASWKAKYEEDPGYVYHIPQPTAMSAIAYDSALLAAQVLQDTMNLRMQCNLSVTGMYGRPLTGLDAPALEEYEPQLYSAAGSSIGASLAYSQSLINISVPDVCPWLTSQVGQGRVMNFLIRQIHPNVGPTGLVYVLATGDRLTDFILYNIGDHERKSVGKVSGLNMLLHFQNSGDSWLHESEPVPGDDPASPGFKPTGDYQFIKVDLHLQPGAQWSSNIVNSLDMAGIRWMDGTSNIPLDSPRVVQKIEALPKSYEIGIGVLVGVAVIYNIFLIYCQIRYRHHKVIKGISPWLNVVFCTGSLGVLLFIIMLGLSSDELNGLDNFERFCYGKMEVITISFSLSFGSLFAKTHRLDQIFNGKKLKVQTVKDRDLFVEVGALALFDVIFLAIWYGTNPFYRHLDLDPPTPDPNDVNQLIVTAREYCRSDNFTTWVACLLSCKGVLVLAGLRYAARVRKISDRNLNDATFIAVATYKSAMLSLLFIVVAIFVADVGAHYLIISIGLVYLDIFVLSILFLPRTLYVVWGMDWIGLDHGSGSGNTYGTTDSLHSSDASSADSQQVKSEVAKLKARIVQLQTEANEMRKKLKTHPTFSLDDSSQAACPPPPLNGRMISSSTGSNNINNFASPKHQPPPVPTMVDPPPRLSSPPPTSTTATGTNTAADVAPSRSPSQGALPNPTPISTSSTAALPPLPETTPDAHTEAARSRPMSGNGNGNVVIELHPPPSASRSQPDTTVTPLPHPTDADIEAEVDHAIGRSNTPNIPGAVHDDEEADREQVV